MNLSPPRSATLIAALVLALCTGNTACTTNAISGGRELTLMSRSSEIAVGERYYYEELEAQGGDFSVDTKTSEYVAEVGAKLAAVSERPDLPFEFTVINSSEAHAWTLPGGKIGITRGLLTQLENEAELAAVLSHQIAHAVARHGAKAVERDIIKDVTVTTVAIGATFFGVPLIAAVPFLLRKGSTGDWLTHRSHSKDDEIEADAVGMKYMKLAGYQLRAAGDLMSRMAVGSDDGDISLNEAHPISRERLASAHMHIYRENQAESDTGETYRERYLREMSWLNRMQAAYSDYEAGYDAYQAGLFDQALEHTRRAISIIPEEARFHELEGELMMSLGRYDDALASFNSAVGLAPESARAYLKRASARRALGDISGAQQDFATSYFIEPTAAAEREVTDIRDNGWDDPFGPSDYNMLDRRRPGSSFDSDRGWRIPSSD